MARRVMTRSRIGCVFALALCTSSAFGADPARGLQDLVADLGSQDIAKREEAMRLLTADTSLTLTQLEAQLKEPALSPEQRCRLTQAAKDRFLQSPRPAMGVQFDSVLPDRVAIETVYDNFPAAGVLKPGDIILSCEGETLRSRSAWVRLGAHIFAHEPGDAVELVVRRGGAKLAVTVQLGRYADLASRAGPGEDRMEAAWDLRSRRFRPDAPAAIRPEMPADADVDQGMNVLEVQKLARMRAQLPQANVPRIVAGGEARGGALDYDELLMLSRGNLNQDAGINRAFLQQRLIQQQIMFASTGIMQTTQQELSALETRKQALEHQLKGLSGAGATRPDIMAQQQRSIAAYRDQIARLETLIQGIRVQAAEDEKANAASPDSPTGAQEGK